MDRTGLLDHAADFLGALRSRHLTRLLVALDDVQPLDIHAVARRLGAQHLAAFAAVLARDHDHLVALLDPRGHPYSTSGASETIFMKLRSRSSRATGPKMRVPRGLFWASISTAAFSSKPM